MVPKLESLWRDMDGPKWMPDSDLLQAKGRPVKSRIRNEMDGVQREPGSQARFWLEGDSIKAKLWTVSSKWA